MQKIFSDVRCWTDEHRFKVGAGLGLALALLLVAAPYEPVKRKAWGVINYFSSKTSALGLDRYRVDIDGMSTLPGNNYSGLAFDPSSNTLWTVTNQQPMLVQLSVSGELMRSIPLQGFKDPEAVEYMSPNHLDVLEERRRRMTEVEVSKDTKVLTQTGHREFSISSVDDENKGFEGLAYNPSLEKWFIAKEKIQSGSSR